MIAILNLDLDDSPDTNGATLMHSLLPNSQIIDLIHGEKPSLGYEGYIITGSRADYNDAAEWNNVLRKFLHDLDTQPCLGICLGMQIIAHEFGGQIGKHLEEGFQEVRLSHSDLFKGLPSSIHVYQSHNDAVISLPRDSALIAKGECIQGFQMRNFTCVQFHPEIDAHVAWKMATRDGKQPILNGVSSTYALPKKMFNNFLHIVNAQ